MIDSVPYSGSVVKRNFQDTHGFSGIAIGHAAGRSYTDGENDDTLSETYANVKRVNQSVFFFFCGVRIYPHTELYRIALADSQIASGQSLLDPVFFKPKGLSSAEIIQRTVAQAVGRSNWFIGSGGEKTARILNRLYARGRTGPLWESLIA